MLNPHGASAKLHGCPVVVDMHFVGTKTPCMSKTKGSEFICDRINNHKLMLGFCIELCQLQNYHRDCGLVRDISHL
jgi:hypothetical protein